MLFGEGPINFNIVFLKIEKVLEFLIHCSRLFHSITADGKYEFLKNVYQKLRNVVDVSCSASALNDGDIIK